MPLFHTYICVDTSQAYPLCISPWDPACCQADWCLYPTLIYICVNTPQAYPLCINPQDACLTWCPLLEAEFGLAKK